MRLATTLGNPNLAASMNALTMPILLYFWSSGRLKIYFALPLVAIILFTVVSTSSNSGLFIMMVSLAVFTATILTMRLMLRVTLGVGILVAGFATFGSTYLLPEAFQKRVLTAYTTGEISEAGTYISRVELIKEAIDMIADERIVIVGIGADQFRERSVQKAPVHNLYLLLWVEGGMLAVIGWVMFSGVGVLLWFSIRKAGGSRTCARGCSYNCRGISYNCLVRSTYVREILDIAGVFMHWTRTYATKASRCVRRLRGNE